MAYVFFNNNPRNRNVGDCTIRAVSKALDIPWESAYIDLASEGYYLADMPSSNSVLNSYLHSKGFKRYVIPDECPDCYSIGKFADDNPQGTYIACTGTHVVCIIDGNIFDSWNSLDEVPAYYYKRIES